MTHMCHIPFNLRRHICQLTSKRVNKLKKIASIIHNHCQLPFLRYSTSNNGVSLKLGLQVIQDHWKWHHSIDHIRLPISLLFYILHRFRDIWRWRWRISWPWNLGHRWLIVEIYARSVRRWNLPIRRYLFAIFIHFYTASCGRKATQDEVVRYGRSRSFNAIKIGTNRKPVCERFPISLPLLYACRFRDITIYWSKICVLSPFLPTPVS